MKKISIVFYCWSLLVSTTMLAAQPDSFTFSRSGHDNEGVSLKETIYVLANQGMEWTTAARGPAICPSSAGTFQVELKQSDFAALQTQAMDIVREQKALNVDAPETDSNDNISTMVVWKNGQDHYSRIKQWTDLMASFNRSLALIQNNAKAKNAIQVSAVKKNKNELVLTFQKLGNGELQLLLSANANDIFHSDIKGDIQYAKAPIANSIILKEKESFTVRLKNIPVDAKHLWYSNQIVKHHGNDNLTNVSICAAIK